jgi:hypothetical protein
MTHRPLAGNRTTVFAGNRGWLIPLLAVSLLPFLASCATPIGTRKVGVRETYEKINLTAIQGNAYSDATAQVLHRYFLEDRFEKEPEKTIVILHDKACDDDRRDLLFALSELTYLTAGKALSGSGATTVQKARRFYLASAVYAYFYAASDILMGLYNILWF